MDLLDECKCGARPILKSAGEKEKHRIMYECRCGEKSTSGTTINEALNNWNKQRRVN